MNVKNLQVSGYIDVCFLFDIRSGDYGWLTLVELNNEIGFGRNLLLIPYNLIFLLLLFAPP